LELNHDITEILLKVALNTINPNAGIKPMLMVIINTQGQNTTWSSKSNGKDKILPGLARAMDRTKYHLV
jgi:hypothetical protein